MASYNAEDKLSTEEQTEVYMGDLRLVQACCCMVQGLYCPSFAKCFGCSMKGEMLCYGINAMCCKMVDSANNEDEECCILSEQKIVCKKPKTVSPSFCFLPTFFRVGQSRVDL